MEVQPTDFENAAYSIFVLLLSRAILHFNLNFYLPISKVDENMRRAQKRDAVRSETFFFRKSIHSRKPSVFASMNGSSKVENEYEELTVDEIINGKVCSTFFSFFSFEFFFPIGRWGPNVFSFRARFWLNLGG